MTQKAETTTEQPVGQAADSAALQEPVATEATPESEKPAPKRRAKINTPSKEFKAYRTTGTHTYPFDMVIKGELLQGTWCREDGIVEFMVPINLVESFERHFHFVTGNLVAD